MKDLYIIGAGDFGREVAWMVERINSYSPTWNLKGFIDDNELIWGTEINSYKVLGGREYLNSLGDVCVVCAIGTTAVRKMMVEALSEGNAQFVTLIDPSAIISRNVKIGEGSIICAGTIITVDVTIGNHVIINLGCTIGHDVILDDYVTIYPNVNISGHVIVGTCCELGTGTKIIQGVRISANTILGAGAVVVNDCEDSGTYVGVPANKIK